MKIPIACTLAVSDGAARVAAWQALLARSLVSRREVDGGVELVFRPDDDLATLVSLERDCCAWAQWSLDGSTLVVTAADAGAVRSLFR